MVKPNRRVYVVKSSDIKLVFRDFLEKIGSENFYLSTIVATDMLKEGLIRLDYFVVLLPEETTITVRTYVSRDQPVIDSIVDIVPGAFSGEMETYDLLGVVFNGNPYLRDGFFKPPDLAKQKIYPLRRDAKV